MTEQSNNELDLVELEHHIKDLWRIRTGTIYAEDFDELNDILGEVYPTLPEKYQRRIDRKCMELGELGEEPQFSDGFVNGVLATFKIPEEKVKERNAVQNKIESIINALEDYVEERRKQE